MNKIERAENDRRLFYDARDNLAAKVANTPYMDLCADAENFADNREGVAFGQGKTDNGHAFVLVENAGTALHIRTTWNGPRLKVTGAPAWLPDFLQFLVDK